MKVTLLFFDGCPNRQVTDARLATLAYAHVFTSNDERANTLNDWLHDYNWNPTHSSIGNHPPISRLR
ncbi:MAG TPA: integrase core domain-containing protein [Ilumatobacteraceae bacterium]|nr:integrase core domain-containing protein [Ilumatobacteraceae bacterium]